MKKLLSTILLCLFSTFIVRPMYYESGVVFVDGDDLTEWILRQDQDDYYQQPYYYSTQPHQAYPVDYRVQTDPIVGTNDSNYQYKVGSNAQNFSQRSPCPQERTEISATDTEAHSASSKSDETTDPSEVIEESDKHSDKNSRYECVHKGCDKVFVKKRQLVAHLKKHHIGTWTEFYVDSDKQIKEAIENFEINSDTEKTLFCTLCKKSFTRKDSFVDHVRRHNSEKYYKCSVSGCNESFLYRIQLSNHKVKQHGQVRPFKCSYCGRAYFAQHCLTSHINKKHKKKKK